MTATRQVRRLRLHASSEALIVRGRMLVEDALRTANLREADGRRVYIVRRLDLGRIDPERAPAALATEIESRFVRLRASAVHADSARAAASAVVYFEDALEPGASLIRRSVEGPAPVEWFWPLAVRGFKHGATSSAALRAALAAALGLPGGSAGATALLAELGGEAAEALCAVLRPNDGSVLTAGWTAPAVPSMGSRAPLSDAELPAVWRVLLERWALRWGPSDRRTLWLATAALRASSPARTLDAALMGSAAAAIATLLVQHGRTDAGMSDTFIDSGVAPERDEPTARVRSVEATRAGPSGVCGADADGSEPAGAVKESPLPVATELPSSSMGSASRGAPQASQRQRRDPSDAVTRGRPDWDGVLLPTIAGGLLFLVHVLHRLGLPAWLAGPSAPIEAGFGARLLCGVARRAEVPADDASIILWGDPQDAIALVEQERPALDEWEARLARWLQEHDTLSTRRVVRRPAWLSATRTHVDVLFGINDADVVLRALGLDMNPGWVPWLGRVIEFHYLERGRP